MAASHEGAPLHECTIKQYGKVHNLRLLAGVLNTPETCVVCNQPVVQKGVLEVRAGSEVTYGKLTIESPDAARIWASLQGSRYWFTFPVCKNHIDNFHKQIYVDAFQPNGEVELKLPNIDWSKQFITQNNIRWAVFKSKKYLRYLTLSKALLILGILGSAYASIQRAWIWLLPTILMMIFGIYLLFKNHYEWLVQETSKETVKEKSESQTDEGVASKRNVVNVVYAIGVLILIVGLGSFIELNNKSIEWPIYIKAGITGIGIIITYLCSRWKKK